MSFLYNLFVVCHMLGLAALVGGYFVVLRAPRVTETIVWGARIQFLSGLILVGLGEGALDKDYDHVKIAVKLVVSLVVLALAEMTRGKQNRATETPADGAPAQAAVAVVNPNMVHAIGVLAIVNVFVAALWN
ncbi:hypothetical protein [Rhodococcus sp. HNM0569]|uniref:hypothetical protein n=1 Tax=Rhodococcus sp. HNM0569 TaxID=2716340 RepID=UPI00146A3210|nr:hypothetical protein [Rhodococcus sp. HNM0569]NLU83824.1 hypothetical protein [Rhodococcus sp. HNM0569]